MTKSVTTILVILRLSDENTDIFIICYAQSPLSWCVQGHKPFTYSKLRYAIELFGTSKKSYLIPIYILHNRFITVQTCKPRRILPTCHTCRYSSTYSRCSKFILHVFFCLLIVVRICYSKQFLMLCATISSGLAGFFHRRI